MTYPRILRELRGGRYADSGPIEKNGGRSSTTPAVRAQRRPFEHNAGRSSPPPPVRAQRRPFGLFESFPGPFGGRSDTLGEFLPDRPPLCSNGGRPAPGRRASPPWFGEGLLRAPHAACR